MFASNLTRSPNAGGLMALVGKMGGEERKTEQSGYKADFSAVYEYNQLMK